MKTKSLKYFLLLSPLLLLLGYSRIGEKTTSISIIYAVTAFLALLLLIGYTFLIKRKSTWFYVLFISVFIVNLGYLWLSVSTTLSSALWANRLSYLGSVFLPISMMMIILNLSYQKIKTWVPYLLVGIAIIIFLVAASPGYLTIYYKEVTLKTVNGVSLLEKVYGPWHSIYLFYLIGCFTAMLAVITYSIAKKKIETVSHAVVLIMSVFVNICVWLLEQLVRIDFEFLSVSYIISEIFLICAYLMLQNQEKLIASLQAKVQQEPTASASSLDKSSPEFAEHCKFISAQLSNLTPTEKAIYNYYLDGKSTKEILAEMSITENTLKFHNKNIYSKLGVSSRRQLIEYAKEIEKGLSQNT